MRAPSNRLRRCSPSGARFGTGRRNGPGRAPSLLCSRISARPSSSARSSTPFAGRAASPSPRRSAPMRLGSSWAAFTRSWPARFRGTCCPAGRRAGSSPATRWGWPIPSPRRRYPRRNISMMVCRSRSRRASRPTDFGISSSRSGGRPTCPDCARSRRCWRGQLPPTTPSAWTGTRRFRTSRSSRPSGTSSAAIPPWRISAAG